MIGQTVSHYRILEEIGAGGMGVVYKAEDIGPLKRKVALKFLPPQLTTDESARRRLLHEANSASSLQHDNICTIHEIGETADGRLFICMDYYEGELLKDRVARGPLDVEDAMDIITSVARGLAEAHRRGIVHRDIKPSNVIVTAQGGVKILDFGLSKAADQTKLTKTGSTVGTIAYMSPEQVRGDEIGHRSDIFSLGVMFYELLTGASPFAADYDVAIQHRILNTAPPSLRHAGVKLAAQLDPVVGKMLAKDPSDRYASAKDVVDALAAVDRSGGTARRKKSKRPVLVAGAVLSLAVGWSAWWIITARNSGVHASEPRLAILYFENVTDRDDPDRLGEVATNLLITDLSESEYVSVVSSQRLYDILKNIGKEHVKVIDRDTATEVARRAGADRMLVGSIIRMGGNVELNSQLVEVASGEAHASQRIRGSGDESMFTLVDRLSAEIKKDLDLPYSAKWERDVSVADITTHSPEAYGYYLEGIEYMNRTKFVEADASLRRAVAVDSTFALAWLALAHPRLRSFAGVTRDSQREALDKAQRYAGKMTANDARYIEASKKALEADWIGAITELEDLCRANPDDKRYHWALFELYVTQAGPSVMRRRINCLNQIVAADPMDKLAYNYLAYSYSALGDQQKSHQAIDHYLQLAPHDANVYDTRGDLYGYAGDVDNARRSWQTAIEIDSSFGFSWNKLGRAYMQLGNEARARQCWEKALQFGIYQRTMSHYYTALIPLRRGRGTDTIASLKHELELQQKNGDDNGFVRYQMLYLAWLLRKAGDVKGSDEMVTRAFEEGYRLNHGLNLLAILLFAEREAPYRDDYLKRIQETVGKSSIQFVVAKSWIDMSEGRTASAVETIDTMVTYNEVFLVTYTQGVAYLRAQRWAEAVEKLERCSAMVDAFAVDLPDCTVRTHYFLARAYEGKGETAKAIDEYSAFVDAWKDADALFIGEVDDARRRLEKLRSPSRKS